MSQATSALKAEKKKSGLLASFAELLDPKKSKWKGIPNPIFFVMLIVVSLVVYLPAEVKGEMVRGGYIRPNFVSILAILAVFGIFFGEIGDRIPLWNKYIGGGTVLVFVMGAIAGTYKLLPETILQSAKIFYNKQPVNFLELFISALIVGSILTIGRKTLIKSIGGYIPLIIIGVLGACVGGSVIGLIFGRTPTDVLMNFVLPIMGGGMGGGAIPMAEMWSKATGRPATEWFAFGTAVLTIANIFAIIVGALLKELGNKNPSLTGNGQLVESTDDEVEDEDLSTFTVNQEGFSGVLFITGSLFITAHFLATIWNKHGLLGFDMHRLAMLAVLAITLNLLNVIPSEVKANAKNVQTFFSKHTIWVLMAAVGFSTNINDIVGALTFGNLLIVAGVVLGAAVSILLTAKIFKFYPIEAAITAGLCMANRSGSGDIAVLSAADRMELISFAQISTRIGGAMMLVFASIIFGILA